MTNILKILFLVFISFFYINEGFAQQKYRLAVEYYNSGEYESHCTKKTQKISPISIGIFSIL